jgi:integrase
MAKNKNHNLFKRGGTWYFKKRVRDKRTRKDRWIKEALSTNLTEARRLRDQRLKEIFVHGDVQKTDPEDKGPLFGELAEKWAKIKSTQIKASTMRDYRSSMNQYVLPKFGNYPIRNISYLDVQEFMAELKCSAKRINNILVPMRSIFTMAFKEGIIKDNVMARVDNLRIDQPTIKPLSIEESRKVIESVHTHYKNCLTTLFFTGMRFGELAALKWANVDLARRVAHIRETLVYGVEGRPKTKKSVRDVDLLPPVIEALRDQRRLTLGKSDYVFLDLSGNPLKPDHVRKVIWEPALKKAGIEYRPLMQTRHTFATIMLSEGENIGWVQNMLGHGSLQMIFTKYYAWIPRKTRNDGSAFMRAYSAGQDAPVPVVAENVAQMRPTKEKGPTPNWCKSLNSLVAGTGFEPVTFGL